MKHRQATSAPRAFIVQSSQGASSFHRIHHVQAYLGNDVNLPLPNRKTTSSQMSPPHLISPRTEATLPREKAIQVRTVPTSTFVCSLAHISQQVILARRLHTVHTQRTHKRSLQANMHLPKTQVCAENLGFPNQSDICAHAYHMYLPGGCDQTRQGNKKEAASLFA